MEDWVKAIRAVRKEKDWTQAELAWKMKVSTESIRKWEKGYGEPNMESRKKFKKMLDEDEDRDEEIMRFIYTLMNNIPDRILNDKRLTIYDLKTRKDYGNLKEYISVKMKALFGVIVGWGEENKE